MISFQIKVPGSAPAEKSPVSPTPAKIPGSAPAEKSPVSPTPAKIPGSAPAEKSPVSPTPAKIPGSAPAEKSPVSPTPAKIPGSAPAEKSPGTDFADKPKTRLPQLKVKVPKTIEEPVAGTPDIVPVNIKTAHGKTFKRNFLQSDKIQDILDYMQMEGYHQMAFTLCTPFPRRDLSDKATQTLKEAGFTSSVLLVMEERDEI
ncbi:PREDICTED: anther-specific proline-rich protein APG-like [Priapulus caudatus]|uniref:Anther-specific proline-rich protein APG-like n=1 Tax=Priapulus caudatus TaxID=37621 RepID=A0ABM1EDF4_PRICU|nr:PREDICTED: anther-specific proline-rich protein APG-like [Priapulus caudatus]